MQTQCTSEQYLISDIENAVFHALKEELKLLDSLYSDFKKKERNLKKLTQKTERQKQAFAAFVTPYFSAYFKSD